MLHVYTFKLISYTGCMYKYMNIHMGKNLKMATNSHNAVRNTTVPVTHIHVLYVVL